MPKLTDFLRERAMKGEVPSPRPLQHAWYKIDGMTVHLDGRNLPHPCVHCHGLSEFLCDFPVTEGVVCNAPICSTCAKQIGPDRHLCPLHQKIVERRKGSLL